MDNGTWSYQRFLGGDEDGLVQIISEYRDGLLLYLNGIVGDLTVAEHQIDIVVAQDGKTSAIYRGLTEAF